MIVTRTTKSYRRQVIQFLVVFAILGALSSAVETMMMRYRWGGAYQEAIAASVARAAHVFRSEVRHYGRTIISRGPGLEVTAECSAVLATGLFCSAAIAFPCRWRRKLVGIVVGIVGVGVLNWIRIFVLALIASMKREWFSITHDVLMQGFLLVMVAPLWMAWVLWAWRPPSSPASGNKGETTAKS